LTAANAAEKRCDIATLLGMVRDEVLGHARGWVLVGGGCTDGGCKRHSGVGGRREIVVPAAIGRGRAEPRRSDRSPAFCAKRCSKILRAAELFLKVQARPWARESTKNRFSAHLGARTGTWAGGAAGATGFDVPSGSGSLLRSPPERQLVDGVANVRGKGSRTRVARLSRGTWDELQALRPADALGDDRVFPMTAWNAWDRVRRAARKAGLEALVSPHFLRHSHGTHALRRGADLATVRETLGHASLSTTGRYLHARPEKSSGDYLAV
jgi:hypothetical protein